MALQIWQNVFDVKCFVFYGRKWSRTLLQPLLAWEPTATTSSEPTLWWTRYRLCGRAAALTVSWLWVDSGLSTERGPLLHHWNVWGEEAEAVCVQHGCRQLPRGGHHSKLWLGRRGQVRTSASQPSLMCDGVMFYTHTSGSSLGRKDVILQRMLINWTRKDVNL